MGHGGNGQVDKKGGWGQRTGVLTKMFIANI